jgi:hypothetical protein
MIASVFQLNFAVISTPQTAMGLLESPSPSRFLIEHDLFGEPVSNFPDHALGVSGSVLGRPVTMTQM